MPSKAIHSDPSIFIKLFNYIRMWAYFWSIYFFYLLSLYFIIFYYSLLLLGS